MRRRDHYPVIDEMTSRGLRIENARHELLYWDGESTSGKEDLDNSDAHCVNIYEWESAARIQYDDLWDKYSIDVIYDKRTGKLIGKGSRSGKKFIADFLVFYEQWKENETS
ncbi:hypothetical protein D1872_81860 [compost metagenome]